MPKSQESTIIRGEAAKAFQKLGLPNFTGAKHLVRSQAKNDPKGPHYIPKESVHYVPRSTVKSEKNAHSATAHSPPPKPDSQAIKPKMSPGHEQKTAPKNRLENEVKDASEAIPPAVTHYPPTTTGSEQPALTVEALLDALDKARDKGYQDGLALGQQEGKSSGLVEGQKQGYEEGYQKGVQEGQQAGRQAIQGELQQIQQQLASVLDGLFQPLSEQDEQLTKVLVDMVTQIARNVIHRELHADSSQITTLVKEAMRMLPAGGQAIHVYLHPQDLGYIRDLQQQLQATWQLFPDEQLLPGGCRVETNHSMVDASVASRLAHYVDAIAEQHLHVHAVSLEQMQHQVPPDSSSAKAANAIANTKPSVPSADQAQAETLSSTSSDNNTGKPNETQAPGTD
ncbi:FliH/SctL family protein [Zooshikella sp. RANM57]|uniref:flagellar assembly protein FliH n=1 Tax=Zooshikella sp. RANM57 TaxID=3425863 RepID=UPI003D6E424D